MLLRISYWFYSMLRCLLVSGLNGTGSIFLSLTWSQSMPPKNLWFLISAKGSLKFGSRTKICEMRSRAAWSASLGILKSPLIIWDSMACGSSLSSKGMCLLIKIKFINLLHTLRIVHIGIFQKSKCQLQMSIPSLHWSVLRELCNQVYHS